VLKIEMDDVIQVHSSHEIFFYLFKYTYILHLQVLCCRHRVFNEYGEKYISLYSTL